MSLSPLWTFVIDRVVSRQLNEFLATEDLLSDNESGYRKRHSTDTAMRRVLSDELAANDRQQVTLIRLLNLLIRIPPRRPWSATATAPSVQSVGQSATVVDVVCVEPDSASGVQRVIIASRASALQRSARVGSRSFAVRTVHSWAGQDCGKSRSQTASVRRRLPDIHSYASLRCVICRRPVRRLPSWRRWLDVIVSVVTKPSKNPSLVAGLKVSTGSRWHPAGVSDVVSSQRRWHCARPRCDNRQQTDNGRSSRHDLQVGLLPASLTADDHQVAVNRRSERI